MHGGGAPRRVPRWRDPTCPAVCHSPKVLDVKLGWIVRNGLVVGCSAGQLGGAGSEARRRRAGTRVACSTRCARQGRMLAAGFQGFPASPAQLAEAGLAPLLTRIAGVAPVGQLAGGAPPLARPAPQAGEGARLVVHLLGIDGVARGGWGGPGGRRRGGLGEWWRRGLR